MMTFIAHFGLKSEKWSKNFGKRLQKKTLYVNILFVTGSD